MAGTKTEVKAKRAASSKGPSRKSYQSQDEDMMEAPQFMEDFDGESVEESEEEKDETEKTLEKLVFGDEEGFLEALKRKSSSKGKELVFNREKAEDGAESADDGDLDDVADADV